jgi:hypothetical protein
VRVATVGGFVSVALGIAAIFSQSTVLLALFVVSVVALWLLAFLRRKGVLGGSGPLEGSRSS